MTTDRLNQQIKLKDGRMLGFDERGNPDGKPVFVFHGWPGSRLDGAYVPDDIAVELDVRAITADRPGMGLSDFKRGREILDWPDDIVELADALGIDQFAVLGFSGGGPYAAACAYKIAERLTATGIVCGMGPIEAPGTEDASGRSLLGKPSLIRKLMLLLMAVGARKKPDQFAAQMKSSFSGPDEALLDDHPEMLALMIESWREAFRSGIGGVYRETVLYTHPWGFRLQDISTNVRLWHGEQDKNVPVSIARFVADTIPNCRAEFFEDEGHLTLLNNQIREVLETLML